MKAIKSESAIPNNKLNEKLGSIEYEGFNNVKKLEKQAIKAGKKYKMFSFTGVLSLSFNGLFLSTNLIMKKITN